MLVEFHLSVRRPHHQAVSASVRGAEITRTRGAPSHLLVSLPSPQQSLALFTSFIDSARLLQSAPFR